MRNKKESSIKAVIIPAHLLYNYYDLVTVGTIKSIVRQLRFRNLDLHLPVYILDSAFDMKNDEQLNETEQLIAKINAYVIKGIGTKHKVIAAKKASGAGVGQYLARKTGLKQQQILYLDSLVAADTNPRSLFWSDVSLCEIPSSLLDPKHILHELLSYAQHEFTKYTSGGSLEEAREIFKGAVMIKNEVHLGKQFPFALFRHAKRMMLAPLYDDMLSIKRQKHELAKLASLLKGKHILEIGSGEGLSLYVLGTFGRAEGIDVYHDPKLALFDLEKRFVQKDVLRFSKDATYDVVAVFRLGPLFDTVESKRYKVEHSPDWTIARVERTNRAWTMIHKEKIPALLKPGAQVLITVISPHERDFVLKRLTNFDQVQVRRLPAAALFDKFVKEKKIAPYSPFYTHMEQFLVPREIDDALQGSYMITGRVRK